MTHRARKKVVENTIRIIREYYVFPDKGIKIADFIQKKMDDERYSKCDSIADFCSALRDDLSEVSQDGHLGVFYFPESAKRLRDKSSEREDSDTWFEGYQIDNYGLVKAEYMRGNVGYLDIRVFAPLSRARDAATHMMNYISKCDALIIDVRNNGGGDPYLVQLIESYFFEGEPKLLLTLYKSGSNSYEQIHTIPHLPGKRIPAVPIYVLTSRSTFSGAEDFSYTLKHHKRALIVGEATGGGANTVDEKIVYDDFVIHIPTGYPVHPETDSNWEGTGVEPDIAVPHEKALGVAHIHALETLIERASNEEHVQRLRFEFDRVKAMYSPIEISKDILSKYVGTYGSYFVDFRDSALSIFSSKDKRIEWDLKPMTEVLFAIENDDYNVRFNLDESGKAIALVFLQWKQDKERPIGRTGN